IRPHLAQYSPIPGTPLFAQAQAHSPYPLQEEPLFQNNALWPCLPGGFTWQKREEWRKRQAGKKT
ncbi:MAG: B12-binding domain-containing radical SAM protein, partial [Desulfovermiculus sp.]|nr:B12-binding domain-containing radical SAM protein [Desulfovermiculus sp.]